MSSEGDPVNVDEAIRGARRTAWRLEQQPHYAADFHAGHYERWLAGEPIEPADTPDYPEWLELAREVTDRGVDVARVRVDEEPATAVNRWARWKGRANVEAGERLIYLPRSAVAGLGLDPVDWWLIDVEVLVVLSFDPAGVFQGLSATDDPEAVRAAADQWAALLAAAETLAP